MNNVKEIEDKLKKRFFSNYDLEKRIVEDVINCKTKEQYATLIKKYDLSYIRDICCQNFATNTSPQKIFKNLKSCQIFVDFI
jgi:hypothetical protein